MQGSGIIFVMDSNERIVTTLNNNAEAACPYKEDLMTNRLDDAMMNYEFTVPADHADAALIEEDGYISRPDKRGNMRLFQIQRVEDLHDADGHKKYVYCEYGWEELNGVVVRPTTWEQVDAATILRDGLYDSRWQVGRVDWFQVADFSYDKHVTALQLCQDIQNTFGGEVVFRVEMSGNRVNGRYVDLVQRRGQDKNLLFTFEKNLKSVKRIRDRTSVATALVPVGAGDADGNEIKISGYEWSRAAGDPADKPAPQDWIGDEEARKRWGVDGRHIFGIFEYDTTSQRVLLEKAYQKLQEVKNGLLQYEADPAVLKQLPGWEFEEYSIGDQVIIQDLDMKPILNLTARIIEEKTSFTDPTQDKVTFGQYEPALSNMPDSFDEIADELRRKAGKWEKNTEVVRSDTPPDDTGAVWIDTNREAKTFDLARTFNPDTGEWEKTAAVTPGEIGAEGTIFKSPEEPGKPTGETSYVEGAWDGNPLGIDIVRYSGHEPSYYYFYTTVYGRGGFWESREFWYPDQYNFEDIYIDRSEVRVGFDTVQIIAHIYTPTKEIFNVVATLNKTDADFPPELLKEEKLPPGDGTLWVDTSRALYPFDVWKQYNTEGGKWHILTPTSPDDIGAEKEKAIGTTPPTDQSVIWIDNTDPDNPIWKWYDSTAGMWKAGPSGPQGPQGIPGEQGPAGETFYTWIMYADDETGAGISNDSTGKEYIGIAPNQTTPTESTDPAAYTWTKIQGEPGEQGPQGIPGEPGADGETLFTWIKYADDDAGTGMSDFPAGKSYIGFAYNQTTQTESTDPTVYQWAKFEGEQGPQGIPGEPGADGETLFTWVMYADDAAGNGISNDPTGKEYIGLAPNQATETESSDPSFYTWTKIKGEPGEQGPQGIPGEPGEDGQPTYTWIKYADDETGAGMSDYPDGKAYIGFAYNKLTQTESTDPAAYSWALFEGPTGPEGPQGPQGPNIVDSNTEIAANVILANHLNVGQLSAITADLGTVTAGTLTADTTIDVGTDAYIGNTLYLGVNDTAGAKAVMFNNDAYIDTFDVAGVTRTMSGLQFMADSYTFGPEYTTGDTGSAKFNVEVNAPVYLTPGSFLARDPSTLEEIRVGTRQITTTNPELDLNANTIVSEGHNLHVTGQLMFKNVIAEYNSNTILRDHGNGNTSLSAAGSNVYIGYYNTDQIILGHAGTSPPDVLLYGNIITGEVERGFCGTGGPANGQSGATSIASYTFRHTKTYTPESVTFETLTYNRTPNATDINRQGFSLFINAEGSTGPLVYWRGYYEA